MARKALSQAEQEPETHLQDPDYDSELELETLSLCDLPLYSHEFDSFKEDNRSSAIVNCRDGDPFEFSSGDLSASMSTAEDIIFCGRLMSYSGEQPGNVGLSGRRKPGAPQKPKKRRLCFRWKVRLFRKQRNPYQRVKVNSKNDPNSLDKCRFASDKYNITVKKVPASTGRVKYRWYLLMFGSARFPAEMELQDIRTRQSRRSIHPSTICQSQDGNGIKWVDSEKKNTGHWILWRLLRTLSCSGGGSGHHLGNAVIKSSLRS